MQFNIILGRAKTGKSKNIYDLMDKSINDNKKVILFVPSQTRVVAEENYMKYQNKSGIIGINITTISSYIEDYIKEFNLHFDEKYISKLDRKILLAQVVEEEKSHFKIFAKSKNKEGFIDLLNIYMDIFRKSMIDENNIQNIKLQDKLLEAKLKEISYIYKKYIERVKEKYIDSIGEFEIFKNKVLDRLDLSNTDIFFDGYNNFTEAEISFIGNLIDKCSNITVTLTTDITSKEDIDLGNSDGIFEVANSTYKRLLKICNKKDVGVNSKILYVNFSKADEDIKYLANNIFADSKPSIKKQNCDSIKINYTTNMYTEIESIAKIICDKIRNGNRYNDFLIYTTNPDKYENVINRVFYEYDIPVYIDKKYGIANSKLVQYIITLINILINGYNTQDLMSLLKLGLNDINIEDIYELENYLIEFNVNKYAICKELKLNNKKNSEKIYDLEYLNNIRTKIIDMYKLEGINSTDKYKVTDIVQAIYSHLNINNVFLNYENYISKERSLDTQISLKEIQVWGKICDIFNAISKIYGSYKISISEFLQIFKYTIKDVKLKIVPPSVDKVNVVDINVNKANDKLQVFFVGVNENEFPLVSEEDIFFSDLDIEKLKQSEITFKEDSISKNNMQLYNIYEALNSTYENLYIYVPVSDMNGKSIRPSSLITNIKQIYDIKIFGDVTVKDTGTDFHDIYSKNRAFDKMIELVLNDNFSDISEIVAMYEYLKDDKRYNDILNYIKNDSNISKETIETIYGSNKINVSVSKLEQFKKCPFSYYMKYCLNINTRKEFTVNAMDIGSFMHSVLEEFSKYLLKNNIYWQAILVDGVTLDKKYVDKLEEIINSVLNYSFDKQKSSIKYELLKRKLVSTMIKVVNVIARGFNQSEFVPFGYEIEFKDGGIYAPIEIKLDNGYMLNLVGKIDRLDVLDDGDKTYARIVDYKSSKRSLKLDDIREGISLQLITYLTAFIENKKSQNETILPAAMLYFNLSNNLIKLNYTKDEEKIESECIKALQMRGIYLKDEEILNKMDKNFANRGQTKYISISKQTMNKSAIDEKEFDELCKEAKSIIKSIGEEMTGGVVKIYPNKKTDACKYCDYSSICRKNICV